MPIIMSFDRVEYYDITGFRYIVLQTIIYYCCKSCSWEVTYSHIFG